MWFSRNGSWLLWISLAVIVWFMTRPQPLIQVTEKFAIAIAIGCTSLNSGHLFARFLEWRPLKFIGVISYSVYVWQELFLVVPSHGIGLLLLPAFSILSWHYIERPGIEFGREFIARYTRRGGSSISLPVGVAEQNHGVECVSP